MADIKEIKALINSALRAAGIDHDEARRETELIVEHATGWKLSEQILNEKVEPGVEAAGEIGRIVELRKRRVPLQYCLGSADFMGLRFAVAPGVFIPRPDTETLVHVVLSLLSDNPQARLLEIGAGSGAVAVSILKLAPAAALLAVDVSADALRLTLENATTHGVGDRLTTVLADWREVTGQTFDGILSNPPYIPLSLKQDLQPEVRDYEPAEALFGWGEDGLGFYREFCLSGLGAVKPGGFVAVEVGCGQAEAVAEIFEKSGLQSVAGHRDLSGLARVISARCAGSQS